MAIKSVLDLRVRDGTDCVCVCVLWIRSVPQRSHSLVSACRLFCGQSPPEDWNLSLSVRVPRSLLFLFH